eukprot:gene4935-6268_t
MTTRIEPRPAGLGALAPLCELLRGGTAAQQRGLRRWCGVDGDAPRDPNEDGGDDADADSSAPSAPAGGPASLAFFRRNKGHHVAWVAMISCATWPFLFRSADAPPGLLLSAAGGGRLRRAVSGAARPDVHYVEYLGH